MTSRVGAGSAIERASWPSGSSFEATSRRVQARACASRRRTRRSSAAWRDEEEGLEGGERPLEVHALGEGRAAADRARAGAGRCRARRRGARGRPRRGGSRLRPRAASRSRRSSECPSGPASRRSRARGRGARAAAGRGSAAPRLRGRRWASRAGQRRRARRASRRRHRRARAASAFSAARRMSRAISASVFEFRISNFEFRPSSSRYTTPSPSSSTRGEKASATSSRASSAARSQARSRPRATSLGTIARAWGSVMPGSMPARRALRVAATTRAALPLPSQMTTASSFNSGSLRSRAARGKSGTKRQAIITRHPGGRPLVGPPHSLCHPEERSDEGSGTRFGRPSPVAARDPSLGSG